MPNRPIQKDLPSRSSKGEYTKKAIDVTQFKPIRNFFQTNANNMDKDIREATAIALKDPEKEAASAGQLVAVKTALEDSAILGAKTMPAFKTREHYGRYSKQSNDIIEDPLMIEFIDSKLSMVAFWGEKVKPLDNKSRMTYGTFKDRVTQYVKAINKDRAEQFKVPRNRTKPNEESLLQYYHLFKQKKNVDNSINISAFYEDEIVRSPFHNVPSYETVKDYFNHFSDLAAAASSDNIVGAIDEESGALAGNLEVAAHAIGIDHDSKDQGTLNPGDSLLSVFNDEAFDLAAAPASSCSQDVMGLSGLLSGLTGSISGILSWGSNSFSQPTEILKVPMVPIYDEPVNDTAGIDAAGIDDDEDMPSVTTDHLVPQGFWALSSPSKVRDSSREDIRAEAEKMKDSKYHHLLTQQMNVFPQLYQLSGSKRKSGKADKLMEALSLSAKERGGGSFDSFEYLKALPISILKPAKLDMYAIDRSDLRECFQKKASTLELIVLTLEAAIDSKAVSDHISMGLLKEFPKRDMEKDHVFQKQRQNLCWLHALSAMVGSRLHPTAFIVNDCTAALLTSFMGNETETTQMKSFLDASGDHHLLFYRALREEGENFGQFLRDCEPPPADIKNKFVGTLVTVGMLPFTFHKLASACNGIDSNASNLFYLGAQHIDDGADVDLESLHPAASGWILCSRSTTTQTIKHYQCVFYDNNSVSHAYPFVGYDSMSGALWHATVKAAADSLKWDKALQRSVFLFNRINRAVVIGALNDRLRNTAFKTLGLHRFGANLSSLKEPFFGQPESTKVSLRSSDVLFENKDLAVLQTLVVAKQPIGAKPAVAAKTRSRVVYKVLSKITACDENVVISDVCGTFRSFTSDASVRNWLANNVAKLAFLFDVTNLVSLPAKTKIKYLLLDTHQAAMDGLSLACYIKRPQQMSPIKRGEDKCGNVYFGANPNNPLSIALLSSKPVGLQEGDELFIDYEMGRTSNRNLNPGLLIDTCLLSGCVTTAGDIEELQPPPLLMKNRLTATKFSVPKLSNEEQYSLSPRLYAFADASETDLKYLKSNVKPDTDISWLDQKLSEPPAEEMVLVDEYWDNKRYTFKDGDAALADALGNTANYKAGRVLIRAKYNIDITVMDFKRLQNGRWYNDQLINYWMAALNNRSNRRRELHQRSYFWHTFFFDKLFQEQGAYNYEKVRKWTMPQRANINIFDYRMIGIPINIGNSHWSLAVVYIQEREVHYIDSLYRPSNEVRSNSYLESIVLWALEEARAKGIKCTISEWKKINWRNKAFQQENGYDCGPCTCIAADILEASQPMVFNQTNMLNVRKMMATTIIRGEINC